MPTYRRRGRRRTYRKRTYRRRSYRRRSSYRKKTSAVGSYYKTKFTKTHVISLTPISNFSPTTYTSTCVFDLCTRKSLAAQGLNNPNFFDYMDADPDL